MIVASKPYNNTIARTIFAPSKVKLSACNWAGLTGLHLFTQGIGAAEFFSVRKEFFNIRKGQRSGTANDDQTLLADLPIISSS
jgi:hypothetical protein